MNIGKIVQVVGPVVDVEFPEKATGIYSALTVDFKVQNQPVELSPEVLLHFQGQLDGLTLDLVIDGQRAVDAGQLLGKLRRPPPGRRLARSCLYSFFSTPPRQLFPSWPPAISSSSLVMLPCRSLLYSRFKSLIRPAALSVALVIATIRALCSLAFASSRTRYIKMLR